MLLKHNFGISNDKSPSFLLISVPLPTKSAPKKLNFGRFLLAALKPVWASKLVPRYNDLKWLTHEHNLSSIR